MKYCSVCKQKVNPIRNYNAGIFWVLVIVGLFVISPIVFLSSFYDPSICPEEKSLSQCMSEANDHVENHVPTIEEYYIFTGKIIVAGIFGVIPSFLYMYLSKKVCPMCNSS